MSEHREVAQVAPELVPGLEEGNLTHNPVAQEGRMLRFFLAIAVVVPAVAPARARQPAASSSSASLDFDYFRARVQPIFTTKRDGNARCVSCHSFGTPMRLQRLPPGSATWNEEGSRKN